MTRFHRNTKFGRKRQDLSTSCWQTQSAAVPVPLQGTQCPDFKDLELQCLQQHCHICALTAGWFFGKTDIVPVSMSRKLAASLFTKLQSSPALFHQTDRLGHLVNVEAQLTVESNSLGAV